MSRSLAPLFLLLCHCAGGPSTVESEPKSFAPPTGDPWSLLASTVGVAAQAVQARQNRRTGEDREIRGAALKLAGHLATGCISEQERLAFDDLQQLEAASLQADRNALAEILDGLGAESIGDAQQGGFFVAVAAMRTWSALRPGRQLGPWLQQQEGNAAPPPPRRTLLGLERIEASTRLRVETAADPLEEAAANIEPASSSSQIAFTRAMADFDQALLDSQRARHDKLVYACETIDGEVWLTALDGGQIDAWLGTLGGTAGLP